MDTYLNISGIALDEREQATREAHCTYEQQVKNNITLRALFACAWLYVLLFTYLEYIGFGDFGAYLLSFIVFLFAPTIWLRIYYHSLVSRMRDYRRFSGFSGNRIIEVSGEINNKRGGGKKMDPILGVAIGIAYGLFVLLH